MTGRDRRGASHGPQETAFFLRHLVDGDVLVLGAGPGRLPVSLARAGRVVVAVEPNPRLRQLASGWSNRLGTATQASCTIVEGDLFTLELRRLFSNVLAPRHAIAALGSLAELDALVGTVRRHLAPQGVFLYEASALWRSPEVMFRAAHWHERPRAVRRPAGRRLAASEVSGALGRVGMVERERYGDVDDRPAADDAPRCLVIAGFADAG